MPSFVVDTSVAVKWVLPEAGQDLALALLTHADRLIAPGLLLLEAANVFWLRSRQGLLREQEGQQGLALLQQALDIEPDDPRLVRRALAISHALDHPVYDCLYLALAERHEMAMVCEDRRLRAKLASSAWVGHVLGLDEIAGRV